MLEIPQHQVQRNQKSARKYVSTIAITKDHSTSIIKISKENIEQKKYSACYKCIEKSQPT